MKFLLHVCCKMFLEIRSSIESSITNLTNKLSLTALVVTLSVLIQISICSESVTTSAADEFLHLGVCQQMISQARLMNEAFEAFVALEVSNVEMDSLNRKKIFYYLLVSDITSSTYLMFP